MTFNFLERCLNITRNSDSKEDVIIITKIFIAMIENLQGRIDQALTFII